MAVLILGTALGAVAAVSALTDTLVVHPLPIPNLDRVVELSGLAVADLPTNDPVAWWGQAHSLEYLASSGPGVISVRAGEWRAAVTAEEVSSNYFRVFGLKTFRGRDFSHEDELPSFNHVAILGYSFWTAHYQGQPTPLGRTIRLGGIPYTIIGIAPRALDSLGVDLWVPRCLDPAQSLRLLPGSHPWDPGAGPPVGFIARLRKGATIPQAHEELLDMDKRWFTAKKGWAQGGIVNVYTLESEAARIYGPALTALFAGAILILLIAGLDCSGFLAARAARQAREIAIRQVLGASRTRLFRQALAEAVALGLSSGLVAALAAKAMLFACQTAFPIYLMRLRHRILVDPGAFLGCLLLGVLVGALSGLLPAARTAAQATAQAIKEGPGPMAGLRGKWLRGGWVVLQVGLTFALVMAATLMIETSGNLFGNGRGYRIGGVFAVHLSIPVEQNTAAHSSSHQTARTAEEAPLEAELAGILDTAGSLGASTGAAEASALPIYGPQGGYYTGAHFTGPFLGSMGVSSGYFRVLDMPFLAGRTFSDSQSDEVVIDELAARELWPRGSPVGRTLLVPGTKPSAHVVVGVVNDTRSLRVGRQPGPGKAYFPLAESVASADQGAWSGYLLLRCRAGCGDVTPALVAALRKVGADSYVVGRAAPLADYGGSLTEPLWIRTYVLSFYALTGLALALGGVFSLSSYLSVERKHEIGIRLALGADRSEVVVDIAKQGILSALIGLAVGAVIWFSAASVLRSLLFGVTSLDPTTLTVVGSLLLGATTLASILPAARAVMRQNPADLLRVF